MKKALYLHIGMGKTGTTALQDFFWENRLLLINHDIRYPRYGSVAHAHHLLSPHIPRFLEGVWEFKPVSDWAPTLVVAAQKRILLSSELIAWASDEAVRAFCAEVSKWFDLRVVIYLRRQDNVIMASYNQQIKAGPQKRRIDQIYLAQVERFDYMKIMAPWVESVGAENVIVRPYERKQFYADDIRRDFMHGVFGIELDDRFQLSNDNANPRLSLGAGEYKRMVNNLIDEPQKNSRFNELLMQYCAELDLSSTSVYSSQSVLSPAQRHEILDANRETNAEIARRYLGRPDGNLFLDTEPEVGDEWVENELSNAEATAITAYLRERDSELVDWLAKYVVPNLEHEAYWRKRSANMLAKSGVIRSNVA